MRMGKLIKGMLAGIVTFQLVALAAYAQDAGLEFGVQDDLVVNGTSGHLNDADVKIKGFTVFGSATGLNPPAAFTNGAGSVVVASNLFVNGQLKAGSIDLSGADMTVSNLTVQGYLHADGEFVEILKNARMNDSLVVGNSLTVSNNAAVSGTLGVTGAATLDSTLGVAGVVTMATNLVVNGATGSSSKDTGAVVVEGGVGVEQNVNVGGALGVTGNGTVGGTLGVTGNGTFLNNVQVNNDLTALRDSVVGRNLVVSNNASVGGTLGVAGAATLESGLTVKGNLMTWGTGTFSNNVTAVQNAYLATAGAAAQVGVGTASPDANTKLDVRGGTNSNDYVAKFYSGSDIAAWIRKK